MHGGAPDDAGRIFLLKALAVAASCYILRLRSDQDQGPQPRQVLEHAMPG